MSVTAAAILFGILQTLVGNKGSIASLMRLIGGLFLTFAVIAPIADVNMDTFFESSWDFTAHGNAIAAQGTKTAQDQFCRIIKDECEAYILDKAQAYKAQLEVEVTLSQDTIPIPTAVVLQGNISPYAKLHLQQWLQDDMGIPRECQAWIG